MKSATQILMVILALTALSAPAFAAQDDASKDCASASTLQSKGAVTTQAPAPAPTSGASGTGN